MDARPEILNHNVETVPRLFKLVQPQDRYEWAAATLSNAKKLDPEVLTKSGIMVGLGETLDEVKAVMRDLRSWGVDILTIGQYLQPSRQHLPIERYYTLEEFAELKRLRPGDRFSLGGKRAAGALFLPCRRAGARLERRSPHSSTPRIDQRFETRWGRGRGCRTHFLSTGGVDGRNSQPDHHSPDRAVKREPNVRAVWLEGADAAGYVDEFSDIDLCCSVEASLLENVGAMAQSALETIGSRRPGEPVKRPRFSAAHRVSPGGIFPFLLVDFVAYQAGRGSTTYCQG